MEYLITLALVLLLIAPLFVTYKKYKTGKKVKGALLANIASFFTFCILAVGFGISQSAYAVSDAAAAASSNGTGFIAAALATGMSCIGAGIAVAASASSALGAISENEKTFGKALIFVALAEGVALYGLLISFQILSKIG